MEYKKKLIEVTLPLNEINTESLKRKQKAPKGFPTSFHKWWAQRPLSACRAVIFASLVDDPSSRPDKFPTNREQTAERERLLNFIRVLIKWENSQNEQILKTAWADIIESTDGDPPTLWDPFCGAGSIPLEGQRLGLECYASDLNPVAVLINKAMIEIPSLFSNITPVNPKSRKEKDFFKGTWHGTQGLAEDVRFYARWMRDEALRHIGHLYPKIEVDTEILSRSPHLKQFLGRELTVIAYLWARTVKSPNPAFSHIDVPLISNFMLSSKRGNEVYIQPIIESERYRFDVKINKPKDISSAKEGTSAGKRKGFVCLMSKVPISYDYIRSEAKAGRMGTRLMAIVAEGDRGRVYLPPTEKMEIIANQVIPIWKPDCILPIKHRDFKPPIYGMDNLSDIFTNRQLVMHSTFSDLLLELRELVKSHGLSAGLNRDERGIDFGGSGAVAYADALVIYMSCILDRMIYYGSSLTTWLPKDNALRDSMPRQALAMTWDFAEGNPFGKSSGDIITCANSVANYLEIATPRQKAVVSQCDAKLIDGDRSGFLFITDPPYYDNINYADLSDYFYVWLRRSLKPIYPGLFSTLTVPKIDELVASTYRHGNKQNAEAFFLSGMTKAMQRIAEKSHHSFPFIIYYAFKQRESTDADGAYSTGWETFLEAVINAGFIITGTWPLRTEGAGRMIAKGTNALASSIVLVCRTRYKNSPIATRRDYINSLKTELPQALKTLQQGNIAPVDLAQAAIGPGMSLFSRYSKIVEADGSKMTVRAALTMINQILDEVLAEQEGEYDADTRWALSWFEQYGADEGPYGVAETLSKAKNTAVDALVKAGILVSKAGKVRLLKREELSGDWDPVKDKRLTVWEVAQYFIRSLVEKGSEEEAAELLKKVGGLGETARDLAYRLYTICERKKWAQEALAYNSLVVAWPELVKLARQQSAATQTQEELFDRG